MNSAEWMSKYSAELLLNLPDGHDWDDLVSDNSDGFFNGQYGFDRFVSTTCRLCGCKISSRISFVLDKKIRIKVHWVNQASEGYDIVIKDCINQNEK